MERYKLQEVDPSHYICTDSQSGLSVFWDYAKFNDTQRFELSGSISSASELAKLANDMGKWLMDNYPDLLRRPKELVKHRARTRIGQMIRQAREKKGLTPAQLALEAGLSRTHIYRIEEGKYSFNLDTIAILCEVLGLEINLEEQ